MLVVDTREPQTVQLAVCARVPDAEVLCLQSADFLIADQDGCTLGIERKRINDFLSSFGDGRLTTQLPKLNRYQHRLIILEGPFKATENGNKVQTQRGRSWYTTGWTHAAFQMKLWSLQYQYGIKVLWTYDIEETADVLRVLDQRARKGCVAPPVLEPDDAPVL